MSKKINSEYTQLLRECERVQTPKLWKAYQAYVLKLQKETDLDREDTLILVQGLSKLGLNKQAFDIIDALDNRTAKENKLWYAVKTVSEQSGDNTAVFKYLTSTRFSLDRLLTKPFRDSLKKMVKTK